MEESHKTFISFMNPNIPTKMSMNLFLMINNYLKLQIISFLYPFGLKE
jgi:hypothetical protein